ncbi:MAG TPA: hypothetical protein VK907_10005, partial [Phnomibacter sp.]|nr:hypothetical protein [Phnomibacter sp.]
MQQLSYLLLLTAIQGMAQNVGIGTNEPAYLLEVSGSPRSGAFHPGPGSKIMYVIGQIGSGAALDGGVEFRHSNGTQGIGFGFNTIYATGGNASQNLGLSAHGPEGSLILTANFAERMRITGAGNVGIGTASPNAPLQFSNALVNRKIVLWEGVNNDHQYFGFGVNASILRYQVPNTANSHVFYAGDSESNSKELLRIRGNGNLVVSGMIESDGFIPFTNTPGYAGQQSGPGDIQNEAGYRVDKMGMVHLRGTCFAVTGVMTQPASFDLFDLPEAFASTKNH